VVSQVALEEAFYGLAWSPDGQTLYTSGAGTEVIHAFAFSEGLLAAHRELRLRPAKEVGAPAGLAVSADGQALYVVELWGQRVEKISAADGRARWTRSIGVAKQTGEMADPEAERWGPSYHPDSPFPYACVVDEKRGRVYVSLWGKATVLVLDAGNGDELARWAVGAHPCEMTLAGDGRLFVAESNRNSVGVIDTATGRVTETLIASLFPDSPPGTMPNSVALTPDGKTLFVANANNNNVALFDVSAPGHAQSLGFIPTGWFPTSVRVTRDGKSLTRGQRQGHHLRGEPARSFPWRRPSPQSSGIRRHAHARHGIADRLAGRKSADRTTRRMDQDRLRLQPARRRGNAARGASRRQPDPRKDRRGLADPACRLCHPGKPHL
jgi:DNA-binding beta-propeller fold protein YncE